MHHFIMLLYLSSLFTFFPSDVQANVDFFYIKKKDGEKLKISIKELELLQSTSITTKTMYAGAGVFTGVQIKDLFKVNDVTGGYVRFFAWDDYSYSITISELENCLVVLAYKKDGKYMSIEEFGPFIVIYPSNVCGDLNQLDVNAKTVMQIKLMDVKENE